MSEDKDRKVCLFMKREFNQLIRTPSLSLLRVSVGPAYLSVGVSLGPGSKEQNKEGCVLQSSGHIGPGQAEQSRAHREV